MQDKALKRGGMSDVRHLEGEMQDENRKARPGYAQFRKRERELKGRILSV